MGAVATVQVLQKRQDKCKRKRSSPASVWSRDTVKPRSPGRAPMPRPTAFT